MSESPLPTLPCMCGSFRRTSRALTQMYEGALRPLKLRATQLTILQVLSHAGEVLQGQLGEMLAMDSTSLTRTRHHGPPRLDQRAPWQRPAGTTATSVQRRRGATQACPTGVGESSIAPAPRSGGASLE